MSIPYYSISNLVDALTTAMKVVVSDATTEDGTGMIDIQDIFDLFLPSFTTPAQTIVSGTIITVAHGLGVDPSEVDFWLVCTTNDSGWTVGQKIRVGLCATSASTSRFNAIQTDATNVYFIFSDEAACFRTASRTDGASTALTNSAWDLYIKVKP